MFSLCLFIYILGKYLAGVPKSSASGDSPRGGTVAAGTTPFSKSVGNDLSEQILFLITQNNNDMPSQTPAHAHKIKRAHGLEKINKKITTLQT